MNEVSAPFFSLPGLTSDLRSFVSQPRVIFGDAVGEKEPGGGKIKEPDEPT